MTHKYIHKMERETRTETLNDLRKLFYLLSICVYNLPRGVEGIPWGKSGHLAFTKLCLRRLHHKQMKLQSEYQLKIYDYCVF